MIKYFIAFFLLLTLLIPSAFAQTSLPPAPNLTYLPLCAVRRQPQDPKMPAGQRKGRCDFFIISNICMGTGPRSVRKYGILVAVTAWEKPFTGTNLPLRPDPKTQSGERLTVVLHRLTKPGKMQAHYEDVVYERGKIKMKFAGTTLLGMPE